ncbi:hypothetical protein BDV96DRAFT_196367 [Lophiotrema nucula]|uniref:Cyclic nucleotide-binding domain-containing protein n=1 Tax=Lophiotrema nucula TaxID=690887 RepID=A0A6A5YTV7_9PLEO|nr:hypothetical protein BDV96DRAFT_196367 [Lophiotrema nucula]
MQRSLAASSLECAKHLNNLATTLHETQVQSQVALSQASVEDQSSRFNLWAGNLGAFQRLPSTSSLDYRLRESPRVATQIQELLHDLIDALQNIRAIASNERANRRYNSDDDDDDDDDSEFEGVADSNDVSNVAKEELLDEKLHLSEAEELFESVKETIASLFRISIIIRKATPRDRFAKALSSRDIQFDERFDIGHVGHKFPSLNTPKKNWLKERLGKANSQRRQYLRYAREHRDKLGKETKDLWQPEEEQHEQPRLFAANWTANSQAAETNLTSTLAPTTASTLHLKDIDVLEPESQDDQSVTSYAMSLGEDGDDSHLQVPRLADISRGSATFECPLCWTIQSIKRESSWRKHVFSDLRPYLCTFEGCDLKLFLDRKEWFDHELHHHRLHWYCHFCNRDDFQSLPKFERHLRHYHAKHVTDEQLDALIEASRRPIDRIPALDCPFCNEWDSKLRAVNPDLLPGEVIVVTPTQFRQHVGSHMQHLALFALPRGYLEDDADAESVASIAAAGVANDSLLDSEDQSVNVDDTDSIELEPDYASREWHSYKPPDIITVMGRHERQEAIFNYLNIHLRTDSTLIFKSPDRIRLERQDRVAVDISTPYTPDTVEYSVPTQGNEKLHEAAEAFAEEVKNIISKFHADPESELMVAAIFRRNALAKRVALPWQGRVHKIREGSLNVEEISDDNAITLSYFRPYSQRVGKQLADFLGINMPAGYTVRLIHSSVYVFAGPGYTYHINAPFGPEDVRYETSEQDARVDASFNFHLQVVQDWVHSFNKQHLTPFPGRLNAGRALCGAVFAVVAIARLKRTYRKKRDAIVSEERTSSRKFEVGESVEFIKDDGSHTTFFYTVSDTRVDNDRKNSYKLSDFEGNTTSWIAESELRYVGQAEPSISKAQDSTERDDQSDSTSISIQSSMSNRDRVHVLHPDLYPLIGKIFYTGFTEAYSVRTLHPNDRVSLMESVETAFIEELEKGPYHLVSMGLGPLEQVSSAFTEAFWSCTKRKSYNGTQLSDVENEVKASILHQVRQSIWPLKTGMEPLSTDSSEKEPDLVQRLGKFKPFDSSPAFFDAVRPFLTMECVCPGKIVYGPNTPPNGIYWVVSGELVVGTEDASHVFRTIYSGDWFGEYRSLLPYEPPACVIASKTCVWVRLHYDRATEAFKQFPLARMIMEAAAQARHGSLLKDISINEALQGSGPGVSTTVNEEIPSSHAEKKVRRDSEGDADELQKEKVLQEYQEKLAATTEELA